jgi:hypothetical protein
MNRFRKCLIVSVGYILIGTGGSVSAGLLAACLMELSGGSGMLAREIEIWDGTPLHRTQYYGGELSRDPYGPFVVQHLHPYYLFSLPWQENDIKRANNRVVSVDKDGFRESLVSGKRDIAILLGGSTAFGANASSNSKTLASLLSKATPYDFINRNAPSWNSHQELIALVKYKGAYKLSVSLSLFNDIFVFCHWRNYELPISDTMESFDVLASYFNDIRSSPLKIGLRPKAIAKAIFPETARLLKVIREKVVGHAVLENESRASHDYCDNKDELLVRTFLDNQEVIRMLTKARGGEHWLVVQPIYGLHNTAKGELSSLTEAEVMFYRRIISSVMKSNFCRKGCLDFSGIFDEIDGAVRVFDERSDGSWARAHFVDEVHLADTGTELVAKEIAKRIFVN